MKNDISINNLKKTHFCIIVCNTKIQLCVKYELIITNYATWMIIPRPFDSKLIHVYRWLIFVKKFFEIFVKIQVYHFSYQLIHIKGLNAKGFLFLSISSLSFIFLKKWSKWPPCLFIERGWIIQNYRRFCDITTTCVPY